MPILTIGHSTQSPENFLRIIRVHGVCRIVDLRTIPRSRRDPRFNQENLSESLKASGIDYVLMKQQGRLRHPSTDSPNMGWRNFPFEVSLTTTRRLRSSKWAIDDLISVCKRWNKGDHVYRDHTLEMSSIIDRRRAGCCGLRSGAYHDAYVPTNTH